MPLKSARAAMARPHPLWLAAALAIGLMLIGLRLAGNGVLATSEGVALDLRFALRGPLPPPDGIVIVAIDDRSIAALRRFPLPRAALATLVERLGEAGARVIALDLLLSDYEPPSDGIRLSHGDAALLETLQSTPNVVLGAAGVFRVSGRLSPESIAAAAGAAMLPGQFAGSAQDISSRLPAARDFLPPIPPFAAAAALGHVNVNVDPGGALRRLPLAIGVGDAVVPGFPLVIALRALGHSVRDVAVDGDGIALPDGRRIATDAGLQLSLNHYGGRGHLRTVAAIDLLDGKLSAAEFAGRIVLIGAAALGVGDSFVAPFSRDLPGVELLATAVANMLEGSELIRDDRTLLADIALLVLICAGGFLATSQRDLLTAAAATLGVWLLWLALLQSAFEAGVWLDAAAPTFGLLLVGLLALAGRVQAQRRVNAILASERANLARYQSPIMADRLAAQEHLAFEGRPQPAGILFVDIAAFTGRSERIGPQGTVDFLRIFHARLEKVVLAHRGVIEHFMGDGAMVIFGIPDQAVDDAARALACGQALLRDVIAWNAELAAAGGDPVRIGVGVHFGPVVMATLGGQRQRQITAAGDTVNVASRLQSLTRQLAAPLAASDDLVTAVRALGQDELVVGLSPLPPQAIRGRDSPMTVWIGDCV